MGSQLVEQQEEWQQEEWQQEEWKQEEWKQERRRFFSEATMAKIPEPEEAFVRMHGDPADQAATAAS